MAVGTIVLSENSIFSFYIADGKISKEFERSKFYARLPDTIWLVTECSNLMVYDIKVPNGVARKNIELVLGNELSYLLPLELDDVCWGYKRNSGNHFSVYVLKKEHFDHILEIISKSSIVCDYFCPILSEISLNSWCDFVPVTLTVPKGTRPIRNKMSRIFYFLLLTIAVALCIGVLWGKYTKFQREYIVLKSSVTDKNRQIKQLQKEFGKLAAEKDMLEQIKALNINMGSILPILHELNMLLPKHMWVSNYVQHSNTIDLTIQSSHDEPNFFRHLSKAKMFKIVNLRKSRGIDSTVIFYVKLQGEFDE